MTYTDLARRIGSTYITLSSLVIDKYGCKVELTENVIDFIKQRYEEIKDIHNKEYPKYLEMYQEMQRKGYLTYEELKKEFKKINYAQVKDNFGNLDLLIFEDMMPRLKKPYTGKSRDSKQYSMVHIIRPCKNVNGQWIASEDREIKL